MTKEQEQLIALVRLAMHPEDAVPKVLTAGDIAWEAVFGEAKKQALIGISYAGIKRWSVSDSVKATISPVDKILFTKWHGLAEEIRQDNLLVNKRTAQVCRNFAKDGFRTSVMKGQGNTVLYDKELALYRASGDVDVWVEGGFQKVYDYVQTVSPTNVINEKEIEFNVFSDVPVEVHYRPFIIKHPFRNRILQKYFATQAEACFTNHVKLQTVNKNGEESWMDAVITTIPFNLVQQLAHIKLHLFTGGIGLRHVVDYYYQMSHAEKVLSQKEKNEIIDVVKSLGLERLARGVAWILGECLGLPQNCQLWEPDKEDGEFLLKEMFRTGNFGRGKKKRKKIKRGSFQSFYSIQKQNLAISRFDRTDWFWGSLWRIYHFAWRKMHGFTH